MCDDILKRLQACAIAGCSPPERALALEAAKEIARLREERKTWCTVDGYPGTFEMQPLPPGPEGDG